MAGAGAGAAGHCAYPEAGQSYDDDPPAGAKAPPAEAEAHSEPAPRDHGACADAVGAVNSVPLYDS